MDDGDDPAAPRTPAPPDRRPGEEPVDMRILFPLYQPAQEVGGRWATRTYPGNNPQEGRDSLAHHFLKQSHEVERDPGRKREFTDAANLLDWEAHDELLVLGHRYRVVRIERYVRFVDDEPDLPLPTEPAAPFAPPENESVRSAMNYGIDLTADTKLESDPDAVRAAVCGLVPAGGPVPREVTEDALVRHLAYPEVVVLPPDFQPMVNRVDDRAWHPFGDSWTVPEEAREFLLRHLEHRSRKDDEWNADSTPEERNAYRKALESCGAEGPGDSIDVLPLRYRIARVIRVVRVGFDGPEPPRDSDPDPYQPPAAQQQEAREQGLLDDYDEGPPPRPGRAARRFLPGDRT
ncbi:DUF5954 family protein [Nocardiopsis ansamitocini]|uniref:PE-PGRS family protein n=1 Tax=Nocardiopsis ansamitocini TaxID=1670832 RepID=A0A9W6PAS6_9ACTN|nr:DUF5954 family protein [Nocardiopsis ansamitocini]GLU50107.1 hypothetical protein Nans01_44580 [Nocardiopsis ansamitocini]